MAEVGKGPTAGKTRISTSMGRCCKDDLDPQDKLLTSNTSTSVGKSNREHLLLPSWPIVRIVRRVRWLRNENYLSGLIMLEHTRVHPCDLDILSSHVVERRCARHMFEMAICENT